MKETSVTSLEQAVAAYQARVQELELANEELIDFIENAAIPLHWVDSAGIITWANQAELTALGYEKHEYIGQPISTFHADQNAIRDILKRLQNNETLHNYRAQLRCKDGTLKHVLISSNVLRKDGRFIHSRCFTKDITAMVLEEQRKSDFVSMVSHELKTPLTSILSYIQIMLSRSVKSGDTFITQSLTRTEALAKSMTKMVNDFLHMSRLEDPKVELNIEKFELHLLIQEMIQEMQLSSYAHNIKFVHNGVMIVEADRAKIGQVLINLISNAIKYSPESSTIIVGYEQHENQVKIYVRDQGIGVSEADQKRLFERFYRVESPATKHVSGFGIGLYLVAQIVRYHNSKIEVESKLGEGSVFYFFLPLEQSCSQ